MHSVRLLYPLVWALVVALSMPALSWAHGVAGKRFFPTTLTIDDPFVADELTFVVGHIKEPGGAQGSPTLSTAIAGECSKRLTPRLGMSLGGEFRRLSPEEGGTEQGFGNLELGARYQLFTSPDREALLSLGLEVELGGTGKRAVEAASFSTISPVLLFGKGFGDLPEAGSFLQPLAITGLVAANFPTRAKNVATEVPQENAALDIEREVERNPITLSWGFTIQSNLQYLQAFVQDVGLRAPLNRLIPLVEVALETCLGRGCGGQTTGTVNPGLIWFGKSMQLGVEAIVPIAERSGKNVGVRGLVHFFIDDLFPNSLGAPIFRSGG
jgi:hypothetical protein